MANYFGVLFNRKSGKIVKVLEGGAFSAMLRMFALQGNVSATRDYVIFDKETGNIVFYCEGKRNNMPNICKDMEGKNIDELCADLRETLELE